MRRFMRFFAISTLFISMSLLANPADKVKALGIELKDKGEPTNSFVYAVRTGNLLFLAGHISVDTEGKVIAGKVGKDLSVKEGAEAARMSGISILSTINQQLGGLDKVKRFVKVTGMVNATPDFTQHATVMNGFSNLMLEVFGDDVKHARAAVGMGSLPANAAVEIEVVLEIKE